MWLRLLSIRIYLAVDRFWRRASRVMFFWRKGRGAEVFLERYRPDHVVSISTQERAAATEWERCQICSLCTFSCRAIVEGKAPATFEPKLLVGVFGKYTHETEVFLDEWFPCATCSACTVLCPNEVPLHALVEQVIGKRNRIGFRRGTHRDKN